MFAPWRIAEEDTVARFILAFSLTLGATWFLFDAVIHPFVVAWLSYFDIHSWVIAVIFLWVLNSSFLAWDTGLRFGGKEGNLLPYLFHTRGYLLSWTIIFLTGAFSHFASTPEQLLRPFHGTLD